MERKTLRQFHRELSWSTRIYTLLTVVTAVGAFLFDAWSTNWALTIAVALAVVLFVESFALYFLHHPRAWRRLRWVLRLGVLLILWLLLSGGGATPATG